MSKKKEKLHDLLLADIQSDDEQRVLDGLNKIKAEGTVKLLPHLIELWFVAGETIEPVVTDILYSLKDKGSVPVIFNHISKSKSGAERQKLISIFWNAGFEPKDYLARLVQSAIEGDFMETFECLTVIENMEPPFPEDQLLDSMLLLKEYFGKNPVGEKVNLIRSISTIIQYRDDTQVEI